jgi:O-antigen ligase
VALTLGLSALGALAAVSLSPALLIAFLGALVLGAAFLRGGADPFIPYLVLVAGIQAGTLLRLPQTGLVSGVLPLVGAWVLVAFLMQERRPADRSLPADVATPGFRTLPLTLAAFFALAFVTTLAQTWRLDARPWTVGELLTLLQLGVLVLITAVLVTSPERMLTVARITILAGCLAALMAVGSRLGLVELPIASQEMVREGVTRIAGTVLDPNIFSLQLLVPLAFALNLAFGSGSLERLLLYAGACLVLAAGIASTYSAGAVVGAGAAVLIAVLLRLRISPRAGLAAVLVVALLTLGVALTLPRGYVEVVGAKYSQITSQDVSGLGTGRGAAWLAATRTLAEQPFLGNGLSSEYVQTAVAGNYREERVDLKAAHNTYLAMGVATGLPGLLLFLAAAVSALLLLWKRHRLFGHSAGPPAQARHQMAVACLLTALLVILTQGLQLDLQMEKYLWLCLGAAVAAQRWRLS